MCPLVRSALPLRSANNYSTRRLRNLYERSVSVALELARFVHSEFVEGHFEELFNFSISQLFNFLKHHSCALGL